MEWMRQTTVVLVAGILAASLTACGSSGGANGPASPSAPASGNSSASLSAPSIAPVIATPQVPQAATVAVCKAAANDVVTDVAGGLTKPATALTNAVTVATNSQERGTGEQADLILAARIAGTSTVGAWAYSDTGIDALNSAALRYSEWGAAAQPGSELLKDRALALGYPETRKALACVSGSGPAGPSASRGANRCGFPQAPDVIEWVETPGSPATAQRLGAYDFSNCTRTADQTELGKETSQTEGFCTIVASLAANPGYNFDAPVAKRPKGVEAESGPAC